MSLAQEAAKYRAPKGWERDPEVEEWIRVYTKEDGGPAAHFRKRENGPCDMHDAHPHNFDGIRLYIARRFRGLSRRNLAERVEKVCIPGVAYSCVPEGGRVAILTEDDVRDFERERREPAFAVAGAIAFALGIRLSGLVECHAPMVRKADSWRLWDDMAPAKG